MKLRLMALVTASALTLSGCAAMLERTYVSASPHLDYSVIEDESILRVETYQALVNALLYFVNQHSTSGTIRLYNYTGDVEADLQEACDEVLYEDPLGVFAVRSMEWDSTRVLTYYEVDVSISYSRSSQAVAAIKSVSGLSGLRLELSRAISTMQDQLFVRLSYFSGDAQVVESLFWLVYYSTPSMVLNNPTLSVSLYPETGAQRIVELNIDWPSQPNILTQYAQMLQETSADLLTDSPSLDNTYTVQELLPILHTHTSYAPTGCENALETLEGTPATDLGLMLAMEALCQQAGIEASMVMGTLGNTQAMWLIVPYGEGYRHLLPQSLRPDGAVEFYTDTQLIGLGYSWPTTLHPACSDYSSATE